MSYQYTPDQLAAFEALRQRFDQENTPARVLSPAEQAQAALAALDAHVDGIEAGNVPFDAQVASLLRAAVKALDNAYGSGRSGSAG